MNVLSDILGRIELDNPVNVRNVQPSCRDIRAQENSLVQIIKLVESVDPLLLFLISMNLQHLQIDVVEYLRVELNRVTAREEYHDFFAHVFLEESK